MTATTARVLADVYTERIRQNEKWGDQQHPNVDRLVLDHGEAPTQFSMARFYEMPTAIRAKLLCDKAADRGECTWAHILIEEVAEAIEAATIHDLGLLADSAAAVRAELVQVAAVAVQWIEKLDQASTK